MIADTTPDVMHKEPFSICVRIVGDVEDCTEHLLLCQSASETSVYALYFTIVTALESRGVTFENLMAQTFDDASNMNGYMSIAMPTRLIRSLLIQLVSQSMLLVYSATLKSCIFCSVNPKRCINYYRQLKRMHSSKFFSVKRLNTVRWNARKFCLQIFL